MRPKRTLPETVGKNKAMSRAPPPVPAAYLQDPDAYAKASAGKVWDNFPPISPSSASSAPAAKPPTHSSSANPAFQGKPAPPPGSPTHADLQHGHSFFSSLPGKRPAPPPTDAATSEPLPLPRSKKTDLNDLSENPLSTNNNDKTGNIATRQVRKVRRCITSCYKSQHACERAAVCAVAVSLLWITSLGLCQAIVHQFISVPNVHDVVTMDSYSVNQTSFQKHAYDECASSMVSDCRRSIAEENNTQVEAMRTKQQQNAQTLLMMHHLATWCAIDLNNGMLGVNAILTDLGVSTPLTTYATVNTTVDPRCPLVTEMLKGQNGGMVALGASVRYSEQTNADAAASLAAYDARAAYDQEYWNNKTAQYGFMANTTLRGLVKNTSAYFGNMNQTYNQFMACQSPTNKYAGETCPEDSVLNKFAQMQQDAKDRYDDAKLQATNWANQANQTITSMSQFYTSLKNNAALLSAFDVLLNFQGTSVDGLGFNAISNLQLGGFSLGAVSTLDLNQIMNDYAAQTQAYLQSMANEKVASAEANARLLLAQADLPNTNPVGASYNPPPVDTSYQREYIDNLTGSFAGTMSAALTTTTSVAGNSGDYITTNTELLVSGDPDPKQFLSNLDRRVYAFFVYDGFNPEEFADAYENLISTCITFDYLFRALYTIQLIIKYWRVSAISTPPADVRTDLMQDKGLAVDTRSPLAKLGAFVAHPATQVIVCFIFGGVIISVFLGMYMPLYNNFVEGCVVQNYTGEGSMVSRNAYAISYNYAAANGDRITAVAVDQLNAQREVDCATEVDASRKKQIEFENQYDLLYRNWWDSRYQAGALASCLDVPQMQSASPLSTGTATGHNISLLTQALPGAYCTQTVPTLVDSVFECKRDACVGRLCNTKVDSNALLSITWAASCLSEEFVHMTFLTGAMVIIVFILINFSRIFAMRGIVRMYWRYLMDGRFTYLGTCERDGELRYPSLITVEKYSMRRAIQESLKVRIFYWEARAWGILLFGLGLNIPWIVILATIKNDTRPGTYQDIASLALDSG
ncbi:hypothetical protein BASA81_003561 [Batrachochytrium salamandrivorans]|nr:hypothetical protein BASA81_003561 [Batrachochytrium salamandrivorans]